MRDFLAYSRTALFGLRSIPHSLKFSFVDQLRAQNLLRYRGSRAGRLTRIYQARSFVDKQMRSTNGIFSGSLLPIATITGRRVDDVLCHRTSSLRPSAATHDDRHLHRVLRAIILEPSPVSTRLGLFNARSVGNKHSAICDLIASNHLHLGAIVETWHDSADDPSLIACAPPGYRFIERARPRESVDNMKTNHGGVCLFYRSSLSARQVQLPVYKSKLEVLAVFIQAARRNVLVIVFYWPGSADVNNAFFED